MGAYLVPVNATGGTPGTGDPSIDEEEQAEVKGPLAVEDETDLLRREQVKDRRRRLNSKKFVEDWVMDTYLEHQEWEVRLEGDGQCNKRPPLIVVLFIWLMYCSGLRMGSFVCKCWKNNGGGLR